MMEKINSEIIEVLMMNRIKVESIGIFCQFLFHLIEYHLLNVTYLTLFQIPKKSNYGCMTIDQHIACAIKTVSH